VQLQQNVMTAQSCSTELFIASSWPPFPSDRIKGIHMFVEQQTERSRHKDRADRQTDSETGHS